MIVTALAAALLASNVAWAKPSATPVRLPLTAAEDSDRNQVVVAKGDHLWKISAHHLTTTEESHLAIAPYWRMVVEFNRPTLRSGDPNLIYPGEVVFLPDTGD
jgi:nucleoid-associated protein YgaU